MPKTWEYQGDMDVLGYGGTFLRHVGDRRFHAIRFDNMEEHLTEAEMEGVAKYHSSLVEVDLDVANIQAAADSWGCDPNEHDDTALAFMVASYGEYAPLHDESSNNGNKLIRDHKRMSREIEGDSDRYEALMNRPVNMIGSTAREFQRGDLDSALQRALAPRHPVKFGLLGPNGVQDEMVLDIARTGSDDPLAFSFGFAQGARGQAMEDSDDLAPEYIRGHAEGLKVFNGGERPSYVVS